MSDLVAHLHVKFCIINALLKHYVLIASRQCFNNVSVKCLGPFFFPYGISCLLLFLNNAIKVLHEILSHLKMACLPTEAI